MQYPNLLEIPESVTVTENWMGYNHNMRIGDGELYDMENMSSDRYPLLAPRKKRGIFAAPVAANGIIAKDSLCYIDGGTFNINGYPVDMQLTNGEKTLVSMGAFVIILPDKKYINTKDLTDWGNIEAEFQTQGDVTYSMCQVNGESYDISDISPTEPDEPANGQLWIDTSSKPNQLKSWSESTGMWVSIATTYVKISNPNIGTAFNAGDGVSIAGLEGREDELKDLSGSFVIAKKADDYIIVTGILEEAHTADTQITIARRMPLMDFVIESENRLWGCRYGQSIDGQVVNEIYASKLGDFKNWQYFPGTAADSYTVSLGSDGAFTGAIAYMGYPIFFKENCIIKMYGSFPAQYRVQNTQARGVQRGSHKSLAIVGEKLYYKSRGNEVCSYDGSIPHIISEALGDTAYKNAAAGGHESKYYISMEDMAGGSHLFVFDTEKGLWHREDGTKARQWCSSGNEMYYIDDTDGKIKTVKGSGEAAEEAITWSATTGLIGLYNASNYGSSPMPEQKYINKLVIRGTMGIGARMIIDAEYDSSGSWEHLAEIQSQGKTRSYQLPIRPKRCDHMRLRMRGSGDVQIFSIARSTLGGSDKTDGDGLRMEG